MWKHKKLALNFFKHLTSFQVFCQNVTFRIIDNVRGELQKRQWIIFDGDVDPEWVENLNTVLDESRLLTLPNGERLAIPPNVSVLLNNSQGFNVVLNQLIGYFICCNNGVALGPENTACGHRVKSKLLSS